MLDPAALAELSRIAADARRSVEPAERARLKSELFGAGLALGGLLLASVTFAIIAIGHDGLGAPAVAALLAAAASLPLAVVSNKQGPILRREAEHLGWAPRFRALVGAGDCAADKPDPAPMQAALAAVGQGASPEVWYVGDTRLDMEAARRAGVSAVLLGDAAHDGGVPDGLCDARFADGHALAAYLLRLDKRA